MYSSGHTLSTKAHTLSNLFARARHGKDIPELGADRSQSQAVVGEAACMAEHSVQQLQCRGGYSRR
eukprot:COSAG01_NODE_5947_length_3890_cov_2.530591_2_plen_66_part_00